MLNINQVYEKIENAFKNYSGESIEEKTLHLSLKNWKYIRWNDFDDKNLESNLQKLSDYLSSGEIDTFELASYFENIGNYCRTLEEEKKKRGEDYSYAWGAKNMFQDIASLLYRISVNENNAENLKFVRFILAINAAETPRLEDKFIEDAKKFYSDLVSKESNPQKKAELIFKSAHFEKYIKERSELFINGLNYLLYADDEKEIKISPKTVFVLPPLLDDSINYIRVVYYVSSLAKKEGVSEIARFNKKAEENAQSLFEDILELYKRIDANDEVNYLFKKVMFDKAVDLLEFTGKDFIIDLFSKDPEIGKICEELKNKFKQKVERGEKELQSRVDFYESLIEISNLSKEKSLNESLYL